MKKILFSLLVISCSFHAFSQPKDNESLKRKFDQAEAAFNNDLFLAAIPLYKEIALADTSNYNVCFKLGVSYLNSASEKKLAQSFLERASLHVATKYNENSYKERNAPVLTWYYLGKAQHFNYKTDEALASFAKFRTFLRPEDKELLRLTGQAEEWCKNAKILVAAPVNMKVENLGPQVNTEYPEYSPVVTADESQLFFTSRRPNTTGGKIDSRDNMYFEDIYSATKTDSGWGHVTNLGRPINTEGHDATIGISVDGQKLFIYKDDNGDGNIYTSDLLGDKWSTPVKLNEYINSDKWEGSVSVSADGSTLYFSSEREGGFGGKDIYMSRRLPNGQWGRAINMGPNVNTADDDDAPFIHPDGVTLYFSSQGHNSMGGFDIFYVTKNDSGGWSKPVNMGYPVNTTDDDIFYFPTADNKRGYFSSFRSDGHGEKDIYMLTLPEKAQAPLAVYTGQITSLMGGVPDGASITVRDNSTGDIIGVYTPNSSTGKYLFILPPGKNYNISYEAEGYLFQSENLDVTDSASYQVIHKAVELTPLRVGEKTALKNVFFASGSAVLKPESKNELSKLESLMKKHPKITVQINGHTDSQGAEDMNMKLSQKRAEAVVDYLVKEGGIAEERIKAIGYGPKMPIAINKNPDGSWNRQGMALNRRIEFEILSIDGKVAGKNDEIKVPEQLKPKDK
jgi:outer membrane protein OmpA-like peptidoglycan-associated protein/Tol biopolymer transport system component